MAGIGFELKKFLAKETYLGLIGAYGFAGLICSGPWVLSIATLLVLSFIMHLTHMPLALNQSFQIIVVYLIAGSLILTSFFQHSYTRYVANECYLQRQSQVVPSLNSVFLFLLVAGGLGSFLLVNLLLPSLTAQTKSLIISSFTVLCLVWICTSVLSGMLAYKTIFFAFLGNFLLAIALGYLLRYHGMNGLLTSYLFGQFFLLLVLIYAIYREFPTENLIHFDFFKLKNVNKLLLFTGFFYNLGIWIDKFIFWLNPITGGDIIDHLRASLVYDVPIFLAYLAAIPGMAIFLLNMETTYTDAHQRFFSRVCGNDTLQQIQRAYIELIQAGQRTILSSIKAQGFILLTAVIIGTPLFYWLGVSFMYFPIFLVCLIAAGLNVILWATLDIVFYLDRITEAFLITAIYVITNAIFTWVSIQLGIFYYGFGLVLSLFITILIGFSLLNRILKRLQFETYMLRN